jgi:Cellulase (glycosyl hydrolase family 5)
VTTPADTQPLPALYPGRRHARPAARERRLGWPGQAVIIAALAALIVAALAMAPPRPPAPVAVTAARYHVWPGGRPPIGITLSGLQAHTFSEINMTTMENQMRAAKTYWHANTVRLQIIQDKLVGQYGHAFNPAYMAYVRRLVAFGRGLGLVMVLNAQTEQSPGWGASEPLPTHATAVFWRRMLRCYRNRRGVVFDVFNEPRKCGWDQWRAAMQPLITMIRRAGARNQIWVEGIRWASTLAGVPLLRDPLHDTVYTIHHPGSDRGGDGPAPSTAQLGRVLGNLAARGVPVVDAEFTNYWGSYDWRHPGPNVRRFLAYLTSHHIGMLAWSLVPGALNSTLDYRSATQEPQGAGTLIRAWFRREAQTAGSGRARGAPLTPRARHPEG